MIAVIMNDILATLLVLFISYYNYFFLETMVRHRWYVEDQLKKGNSFLVNMGACESLQVFWSIV